MTARGAPVPFTIGLKPIEEPDWLRPDDRLPLYLDEKARLNAVDRDAVFASIDGMTAAQAEAEAMVSTWLAARSERHDERGEVRGRREPDAELPPLLRAAMRSCEDLVLMRRVESGWLLAAASLHFPSAWVLAEKIGRPLQTVHAPVPAFQEGTRYAALIDRMFDNLRPGTVVARGNWSLHAHGDLHLPRNKIDLDDLPGDELDRPLYRRAERQTLRRLPVSGDILFTIDVSVHPFEAVNAPERSAIATHVRALDRDQRAYKGMVDSAEAVAARLDPATTAAAR